MVAQQNNLNIISFEEFTKKTKPVFIFGLPRSGTTLSYNVMKFHPQVLKLPLDTYFFSHFWNIRDSIPIKAQRKILLWTCNLTYDQSKSSSYEIERERDLQKTLINLVNEGDPKKILSFMAYIFYVQKADNKNRPITWWAERTNDHLYYYQTLKDWFPLCKFIYCIRDPRAAVTSALGALNMQGNYPLSVSNFCVNSAIEWVKTNRIVLEIKRKFRDDVFISKYESFVKAPTNHINSIWKFLGLPKMSEPELINKINCLGQIYPSKTGVIRPTGIDTKSLDRWKELLSPTDIMIIGDITKEMTKLFNYKFKYSKVPAIFYVKRFEKENLRIYIKRLMKLLFYKIFPLKLSGITGTKKY